MSGRVRLGAGALAVALLGSTGAAVAQESAPLEPVAAAADEPGPLLRRDGDFLNDRPARLVELAGGALGAVFESPTALDRPEPSAAPAVDDDGRLAAPPRPEPDPTLPPMVLQPSRQLDALREVRLGSDPDARFSLTGRVQRYRGRNHLLLTGFAGLASAPSPPPAASAAETPDPTRGEEDPATASVEALMADLDADATRPSSAPEAATPPRPTASAPEAPASAWRDGELVARRLGRVVPAASGASAAAVPETLFVFDSGDPPLRLLPGSVSERAEDLVAARGDLLFELSGQVSLSGRDAWVLPAALRWRPAGGRVDDPGS